MNGAPRSFARLTDVKQTSIEAEALVGPITLN
jgi:hypothetical protein